jgi:hypothetical protein
MRSTAPVAAVVVADTLPEAGAVATSAEAAAMP